MKYMLLFIFALTGISVQAEGAEQYGYIDSNGTEIIPLVYEDALPFSEGLAAVKKESKYGFIDKTGKIEIDFIYDYATIFKEDVAAAILNGKIGYIRKNGEVAIPFIHDSGTVFQTGLAGVVNSGKLGYIDVHGNYAIECLYDNIKSISLPSEGLINVKRGKKWGYIDTKGNIEINFIFDAAFPFSNGRAYVGLHGKYGFINRSGEFLIPAIFDYCDDGYIHSSYGYSLLCDMVTGFNRYTGNIERFPLLIDNDRFNNGYARVKFEKKIGFIDPTGKIVIPVIYDDCTIFSDHIAFAWTKERQESYILQIKNGLTVSSVADGVIPITPIIDGYSICITKNNKYGIVSADGKVLIYENIDSISGIGKQFIFSRLGDKRGILDVEGKIIVGFKYNKIFSFTEDTAIVTQKKSE